MKVRDLGGPTFKPLSGGEFRCNQLFRLGRLNRSQVVTLKAVCALRGTPPPDPPPASHTHHHQRSQRSTAPRDSVLDDILFTRRRIYRPRR